MAPLLLESRRAGLDGARAALTVAPRRPQSAWAALLCAGLMTAAALAAAGVVVLGGWEPDTPADQAGVRAVLAAS